MFLVSQTQTYAIVNSHLAEGFVSSRPKFGPVSLDCRLFVVIDSLQFLEPNSLSYFATLSSNPAISSTPAIFLSKLVKSYKG